ncbi:MAG: MFS transporter [Pseudorhodobacter sp.]
MGKRGRVVKLAIPVLASGFFGQIIGLSTRIAISYEAVAMGLQPFAVLALSSVFSFLPIFMAMHVGRFNDRNGSGPGVMIGAIILLLGVALPVFLSGSVAMLVLSMACLGVGQTLQIAALQAEISQIGRARLRDRMIGGFMLYQSLGQVLAPLMLTTAGLFHSGTPHVVLFRIALGTALVQLALAAPIRRIARHPGRREQPVPFRTIISTQGLVWLAVSGSLCVATQEIAYVFTPIIGTERNIEPAFVGIMLGTFAITQLIARAAYSHAARILGRERLMAASLAVSAITFTIFALPLPPLAMTGLLAIAGLSLGFAVTCSVSLTMQLAPARARATTLSLRLAVNRIGQFALPLVSGSTTALLGVGGVFLTSGLVIAFCLPLLPATLRHKA